MKIIFVSLLSLGILPLCQAQSHKPATPAPDLQTALKLTQQQNKQLLTLRKPILKQQYELDQEKLLLIGSLNSIKDSKKRDNINKHLITIDQEYQTLLKKNKQVQDSVLTKQQQALVKVTVLREHKK